MDDFDLEIQCDEVYVEDPLNDPEFYEVWSTFVDTLEPSWLERQKS